ncbi:MAG: type I-U CRISPR-associated protein Csx17 [Planctomycetaceae bacterium]
MSDIELPGCTPEPLMNYLKALGVFRLVAEDREHGDPAARLSWSGGKAVLQSKFDRDSLMKFFLEDYRPTPIVAPWNGGSGFYAGGSEPLEAIATSTTPRLQHYRDTIRTVRAIVPEQKPKDDDKLQLLTACRNELNDEVGGWLDSCFVLREDSTSFFPLLGTGGNDGRLDFTNNFFQRLNDVIGFAAGDAPTQSSRDYLSSALFADTIVSLGKSAIGQFNPGGIGGPNGTQGRFEADSRVNPWEFVLMIEGVLLFAGSVARRLGVGGSLKAAFPFTVDSVVVGSGSFCEKDSRNIGKEPPNSGELWLPLWSQGTSLSEVKHLFAEGRAQIGRSQARNSIEFGLAICTLGINRGIESFARYGFLRRNGKAFLATPIGRFKVEPRPKANLLNDPMLVRWIDSLRAACVETDGKKDRVPARFKSGLRQIDRSMFDFTSRSENKNNAKYLVDVLRSVGRTERVIATQGLGYFKDKQFGWRIRPLQRLNADWLLQTEAESAEVRLAASLAGIRSVRKKQILLVGPIRHFLEPVEGTKRVDWTRSSDLKTSSSVWSARPSADNLAAIFLRRQMEAFRQGLDDVSLRSPITASLDDVIAFLEGNTDDEKLSDLLWAFIGLNWSNLKLQKSERPRTPIPIEFGIPRLLVQRKSYRPQPVSHRIPEKNRTILRIMWRMADVGGATVVPDPTVFHHLASGRDTAVADCVDEAARRLKSSGLLVTGYRNRRQAGQSLNVQSTIPPERLLASMLFPLSDRDLVRIANTVLYPPESEE